MLLLTEKIENLELIYYKNWANHLVRNLGLIYNRKLGYPVTYRKIYYALEIMYFKSCRNQKK